MGPDGFHLWALLMTGSVQSTVFLTIAGELQSRLHAFSVHFQHRGDFLLEVSPEDKEAFLWKSLALCALLVWCGSHAHSRTNHGNKLWANLLTYQAPKVRDCVREGWTPKRHHGSVGKAEGSLSAVVHRWCPLQSPWEEHSCTVSTKPIMTVNT